MRAGSNSADANGAPRGDPPAPSDALQQLSLNLARAAATVQAAMVDAAGKETGRAAAPDFDPLRAAPALAQVAGRLAASPDTLMRAQAELFAGYLDLWHETALRASGVELADETRVDDKRFRDATWSEDPVFDVMRRSYLLSARWLNGLVAGVAGVDPLTKRRAEFFTQALTDALSPTNFLLTNPAAMREAVATKGESLVRGAENFARDLARGGGRLSVAQTDLARFEVGHDVATAPGKVMFQNDILQLLQFAPATETVHEVPLLIFPPWINKYYILDLRPENSMIRWLTRQGFTVFVASWVNPEPELSSRTFADYMREGIGEATAHVRRQTGVSRINAVGYCIGGTALGAALARMAATGEDAIASATFFAAQQDFSEAGDLLLFTDDAWLAELEARMDAAGGVLPGAAMAETFNSLRANDLVWSFFVNNYLLGKEPAAFDLLFWNADQTRMPKALHLFYLRNFYRENRLARGELEIDGVRLDLGRVRIPVYVQASREDHIAPFRSVYKGARLFGGEVVFTLAGSGHIAGVINPPSANKYNHWTSDDLPDAVETWQAGATERAGSWWPHWAAWLKARSGGQVPARDPAAGPLAMIEDAPGSYVKVRG